MEQKQAANYDNLLLDQLNTSVAMDVTLSTTPKLLCISIPLLFKNHPLKI